MGRTRTFRTLMFTAALSGVFFGFAPGMDTSEAEASWLRQLIRRITGRGAPPSHAVPELDPSAAGQAAVLVLGGAWLIAEQRRRKNA